MSNYALNVTYDGKHFSPETDKRFARMIHKRDNKGSGFAMPENERDLTFMFKSLKDAKKAKGRIHLSSRIKRDKTKICRVK